MRRRVNSQRDRATAFVTSSPVALAPVIGPGGFLSHILTGVLQVRKTNAFRGTFYHASTERSSLCSFPVSLIPSECVPALYLRCMGGQISGQKYDVRTAGFISRLSRFCRVFRPDHVAGKRGYVTGNSGGER